MELDANVESASRTRELTAAWEICTATPAVEVPKPAGCVKNDLDHTARQIHTSIGHRKRVESWKEGKMHN